jgi:hypothetical protein
VLEVPLQGDPLRSLPEDAMIEHDDSPVLTDAEARVLTRISQATASHRELELILGASKGTINRLIWRSRRVRPSTMARVRIRLRRAAEELLAVVHEHEGVQ